VEKVRTQTNLVKRGSVYYFRKKIPADLAGHYGGRESIRKSLADFPSFSSAKAEAQRLARLYDVEFEAARRAMQLPPVVLSREMVPALAQALEAHILTADEEMREQGLDDAAFDRLEAYAEGEAAVIRRAYARGDTAPARGIVDDWLGTLGIEASKESEALRELHRAFLKAKLKALDGQLQLQLQGPPRRPHGRQPERPVKRRSGERRGPRRPAQRGRPQ
jgi:hypothetical protein